VRLSTSEQSPLRFSLFGAIAFGLVSLAVFATVAFAESWMYKTLGLYGAYLAWTVLFILLGGGALGLLVKETMSLPRFYGLFCAAFFLYAVGWVAAYFMLRDGIGEWVASVAGSVLMALVFAAGFGILQLTLKFSVILFIANSAGYFLGLLLNASIKGKPGMLLWGLAYGLFLGAGLGYVLYLAQRPSLSHSKNQQVIH
jgi:hypothetical protein